VIRRRVPLSRLWGASLFAAGAALLAAAWFLSRDFGISGQVQALDDARRLSDQLEDEAARLVQRLSTGQIAVPGGGEAPTRVLYSATGELLEPRPFRAGQLLRDVVTDSSQPRPTPAFTWLQEAQTQLAREEWGEALEATTQAERSLLVGEEATRAATMLAKARALLELGRARESARVLESLRDSTQPSAILEDRPLRLLLGNRIAEAWEIGGSPASAQASLLSLFEEIISREVPLPAGRLGYESRSLAQNLQRADLLRQADEAESRAQLAAALVEPLRDRPAALAIALPARVALLDRESGSGLVLATRDVTALLAERFKDALPNSGAFQVAQSRGGSAREVALRLVLPPGLPDDWWLVLADPEAYTEPAVRRRSLLLTGVLVLVAALGIVGVLGSRALRRRSELEQMRSDFIAGVSHELRTPAASLALLANNLLDGRVSDPERLKQYYSSMQRDADRLQRLVADVLDASRLERGSFKVEPTPTDVAALLVPLVEDQRPRLADAGLELSIAVDEDLPEVKIDPSATERAVANLIENARKYATSGEWVEFRIRVEGNELLIEVEDRGPGVSAADGERIFSAYERGAAEDGLAAGAGLGLALVRETMQAHGGHAELISPVPGQQGLTSGACFRLRFPLS